VCVSLLVVFIELGESAEFNYAISLV
jgi:hypothetical protein